ncbi:unnamed protein product [Effrenium voratum]|nr:unnamed protein product [Effrenium voratum]
MQTQHNVGQAAHASGPLPDDGLMASQADDSSGDEVCFAGQPLLAEKEPSSASDRGSRACARARMETLGVKAREANGNGKESPAFSPPSANELKSKFDVCLAANPMTPVHPASELGPDGSELPTSLLVREHASDTESEEVGREEGTGSFRSWWSQFFHLRQLTTPGAATLTVSMARADIHDTDLTSLTAALDRMLAVLREASESDTRAPVRVLAEFDLSDNTISDAGAVWLFRWLMQRQREVRCRAIRLGNNQLTDASLEWLAALIRQQHSAIEEIHLASNRITSSGCAFVLLALALHPLEAYPWLDRAGRFAPCWLDLQQNALQDSGSLLARLRLRAGLRAKAALAGAARGLGASRRPHFQEAPHALLPGLDSEKSNNSMVLPLALEKVCSSGAWPALPELAKPAVQASEVPQSSKAPAHTVRRNLMVDEEEGAGLELETLPQGLRVCEILEVPGQPGLHVGDTIVAVDGLPLWSHACAHDERREEDEEDDAAPADCRFRERFRMGARLDVVKPLLQRRKNARFCCPVCWDCFDRWHDCLKHLREFGHEPPDRPARGTLEASACIRHWMATCMAAARGEIPRPAAKQEVKVETLLLPAPIGYLGERNRSVVVALAEETSRVGADHGCTVWTLPDGLHASYTKVEVASVAQELLRILHFHLPDLDDKDDTVEEVSEWNCWLEQMLQQQSEEARGKAQRLQNVEVEEVFLSSGDLSGIRLLVLCGLPGSGKSTLASRMSAWSVVNQDLLGSRQACMKAMRAGLKQGTPVVIDRCNATRAQRNVWTQLGAEFQLQPAEVACLWLDVPEEECGRRVLRRFGHSTLPPREASLTVIHGFAKKWQPPSKEEGFGHLWRVTSDRDLQAFCEQVGIPCEADAVADALVADAQPASSVPQTWTCGCGEINKLSRAQCNNCAIPQPRSPSPSTSTPSERVAWPREAELFEPRSEPRGEAAPKRAPAERQVVQEARLTGHGADFWRLPMPSFEEAAR